MHHPSAWLLFAGKCPSFVLRECGSLHVRILRQLLAITRPELRVLASRIPRRGLGPVYAEDEVIKTVAIEVVLRPLSVGPAVEANESKSSGSPCLAVLAYIAARNTTEIAKQLAEIGFTSLLRDVRDAQRAVVVARVHAHSWPCSSAPSH